MRTELLRTACGLLALLALCACGAEPGTERGACYGNGTCNAGLLCLSDRCVRPDDATGADASGTDDRAVPYPDAPAPPWDGLLDLDSGGTPDVATGADASPPDAPSTADAPADSPPPRDAPADVVRDAGPMMCLGGHPLFDGGARWCDPGSCYCANPDRCFRREIVDTWPTCCSVAVVCY